VAKSKEELRVQINYNISGRTVNYVLAAILGGGGYFFWPDNSNNQEISRVDKQLIIAIQRDVQELKLSMKVFNAMLAEENRKIIESKK